MAKARSFRGLSSSARRDPARAHRIDAAKRHAWEDHVDHRLADVRRALGLTQQELAELIGKSQSAVSQIESGEITLSVEVLGIAYDINRTRLCRACRRNFLHSLHWTAGRVWGR